MSTGHKKEVLGTRTFEGVGIAKTTVPRIVSLGRNTITIRTKTRTKTPNPSVEVGKIKVVVGAEEAAGTNRTITEIDIQKLSSPVSGVQYPGLPKFPLQSQESFLGGRLAQFAQNWALITQDSWVLNTLKEGFQWIFYERPPLLRLLDLSVAPQSSAEMPALRLKVRELLLMNTIELVHDTTSAGFYSRFFVVPKKAPGEWRAVLDLMALNQYIPAAKFKMETAESIRRDLNPRKWTTSIDLKDAYMHVPI
jgi:hypothetical protein